MKKVLVLIVLLLSVFVLVGCDFESNQQDDYDISTNNRYVSLIFEDDWIFDKSLIIISDCYMSEGNATEQEGLYEYRISPSVFTKVILMSDNTLIVKTGDYDTIVFNDYVVFYFD